MADEVVIPSVSAALPDVEGLPDNFETVVVRGLYLSPDDRTPARGFVDFELNTTLSDPGSNEIIPPIKVTVKIDRFGVAEASLVCTDNPDTDPNTGIVYKVTERIFGAPDPPRSYYIEVPTSSPLGVIDLADVAPALPGIPVYTYALASALTAHESDPTAHQPFLPTLAGTNTWTGTNIWDGNENHAGIEIHTGSESHSGEVTYSGDVTLSGDVIVTGAALFGGNDPWCDVKAFGAVGDGATDDTAAIQAAIDSLGATTGGTVFFPRSSGTYRCTGSLNMSQRSGVVLMGYGMATGGGGTLPVLEYVGTGARFIDVRSTQGVKITGLMILYASPSFTGNLIDFDHFATTVASSSNGVDTATFAGAGVLNVESTAGFATSGTLYVGTLTNVVITYTGKTSNTFTGCTRTSGTGILATGDMVDPYTADSSLMVIEDCYVGGIGGVGQTAILVNLNKSNDGRIVGGNFVGGGIAVRGKNGQIFGPYSNGHTISGHPRFYGQANAAIYNAGQSWIITAVFEGGIDGQPRMFKSDTSMVGLTFESCWAGDFSANGTLIDIAGGAGINIRGCYFGGHSAGAGKVLKLGPSTNAVVIEGNVFEVWQTGLDIGTNCFNITERSNTYQTVTTTITGTRSKDTILSDVVLPALSSGDVTIGAGFGSTASVTSITGTDNGFHVIIQANGSGIAGSAGFTSYIQVHFKVPWQTQPMGMVSKSNSFSIGDVASGEILELDTLTDAYIYWVGIPTAGRSYGFRVRVGP